MNASNRRSSTPSASTGTPPATLRGRLPPRRAAGLAVVAALIVLLSLPGATSAQILSCSPGLEPSAPVPQGLRFDTSGFDALRRQGAKAPSLATSSPFQFVLRFGTVLPQFVLLTTGSRTDLPISFLPASPPPGVVVDEVAGTISFFVPSAGPWFIQVVYDGDGQDIFGYRVLTPGLTILAGQPRTVEIGRTLANRTITFRPVDFRGADIPRQRLDVSAPVIFRFNHRQTGNGCSFLGLGFGRDAKVLVSDVPADYSFGAVAVVGRQRGLPLHVYLYSFRRGIRSDLLLTNTAAQLTRRDLRGNSILNVAQVLFVPDIGFVEYSPAVERPFPPLALALSSTETLAAGARGDLYALSVSDAPLVLDAAAASMPDFPVFDLRLAAAQFPSEAETKFVAASPLFTGNADAAQSFLSVDTGRAVFARLDTPLGGQVLLGTSPLYFTATVSRNCEDGSLQLLASQVLPPCYAQAGIFPACFAPILGADGANQGSIQELSSLAVPSYKLRRGSTLVTLGNLPIAFFEPGLLFVPPPPNGDYRLVLSHPGNNIAGGLVPIRNKSFFKFRAASDSHPPALTKVQLIAGGRLAHAISAGAVQDTLRFGIDPVPGVGSTCQPLADSVQTVTLEVSRDGRPFAAVPTTVLPSGDRQALLPAAGTFSRFDFKLTATDRAANRLVARFALGVTGRGPGPAAVPDTAFAVSPTTLAFSAPAGSTAPLSRTVSAGSLAEPIGFTASANQPWLTVGPGAGVTPLTLTVTANPAGLAPGQYQGTVTLTAEEPLEAAPATIAVSLTIGTPQGPSLTVSPASLSYSATQGGANPASRSLAIGSTGGALAWSVSDNAPWLTLNPISGFTPGSTTAFVNIAGLAAGTYNATLTVSAAGAGNSPVSVPVSLSINPAPPTSSLTASPTALSFQAVQGGANPPSQALSIGSTGGALAWSVSDNAPWLTLSPVSGSTPGATTAFVNIAGLAAGTYNATLTVSAAGAGNSPVSVPVSLSISPPPPVGLAVTVLAPNGGEVFQVGQTVTIQWQSTGATSHRIQVSTDGLNFNPIVTGLPAGQMSFAWTIPASIVPIGQASVQARIKVIARNDTLNQTAEDVSNAPFTISLGPPPANLTVAPGSVSFSGTQGGANPPSQFLSIGSTAGTLSWSASENASWLSLNPTSGTTPGTTTASVNLAGLAAGSYSATITVSAAGAGNSPLSVPVALTVSPAQAGCSLSVSPASLSFTAPQGGPNPSNQFFSITSSGGPVAFAASESVAYLSLSPAAGNTPTTVTVAANVAGLAAGTYSTTIVVACSADPSDATLSVPVTLSVTGGGGGNALTVSPPSLSFQATQGGANPPSQSLAIGSTGSSLTWSATDNAPWLTLSPASGSTPGSTTASVNVAGLAAGSYGAAITVTSFNVAPVSVPVSLTVAPPTGGGQLIANGGFEGNLAPWTAEGDVSYENLDGQAHSGTGYALLQPTPLGFGTLGQSLSIPAGSGPVNLTFFLRVDTLAIGTIIRDRVQVVLASPTGQVRQSLATFTNVNPSTTYLQRGPYDLSAFRGQNVRLEFRSFATQTGGLTQFRLDDVSVQ